MSVWALLDKFWLLPGVAVNLTLFINMLGALLLGLLVGYERSYHGRAAGMRTYGMVCMASCALTVLCIYPQHWLGDHSLAGVDPTRVIQGVVTGIGFLGAGLMMWGAKLEARLPSRPAIAIVLRFAPGFVRPEEATLRRIARERGYVIAGGSFSVNFEQGQLEWRFVAVAVDGQKSARISDMADELAQLDGVAKFHLAHARN
ncbi:MgtC/SapB family protein [Pseudomonas sp. LjRoot71]|uniref:MgtC/SapB family protein n=1 Tax=Pseudomonas sp. LjRoot71 TaxID=3342336 RepID=UPI003ECED08A